MVRSLITAAAVLLAVPTTALACKEHPEGKTEGKRAAVERPVRLAQAQVQAPSEAKPTGQQAPAVDAGVPAPAQATPPAPTPPAGQPARK